MHAAHSKIGRSHTVDQTLARPTSDDQSKTVTPNVGIAFDDIIRTQLHRHVAVFRDVDAQPPSPGAVFGIRFRKHTEIAGRPTGSCDRAQPPLLHSCTYNVQELTLHRFLCKTIAYRGFRHPCTPTYTPRAGQRARRVIRYTSDTSARHVSIPSNSAFHPPVLRMSGRYRYLVPAGPAWYR